MRMHNGTGPTGWRRGIALGALIALFVAMLAVLPLATAQAEPTATGSTCGYWCSPAATVHRGDRHGPGPRGRAHTTVNLSDATRAPIDAALPGRRRDARREVPGDRAAERGRRRSNRLTTTERDALAAYERSYGVRQVDAYDCPGSTVGMDSPGLLPDPWTAASSPSPHAGLTGPFSYLNGSLTVDDVDPNAPRSTAILAAPSAVAAGRGDVHPAADRRRWRRHRVGGRRLQPRLPRGTRPHRQLTTTSQQWFNEISHGLITWMTRGVHLGYQRNYFAVQVDDVFLPDSRWSATGHCTPGDGCADPKSPLRHPDDPDDVANLVAWQNTNGFKLDMVFNGGGSDLWKADQTPAPTT